MNKSETQIISSLARSYTDCNDKVLKDFYLTAIKDILAILDVSTSPEQYEELTSKEKVAALSPDRKSLEESAANIFGYTLEEYKFRILAGHLNAYINAENPDIKELEKNVIKDMIKILN